MTPTQAAHAAIIAALSGLASERTGIREDALRDDGLRELAAALLARHASVEAILAVVERRDAALCAAVESAVVIGETYFFRQPEHFAFIAEQLLQPGALAAPYRAWSAGCSTGEEAYSISSALLAQGARDVAVVGTDVRRESIAVASQGRYPRRSIRHEHGDASPFTLDGDAMVVREALREVTFFEVHNLLEHTPEAQFDLVLCRNVLVYFTAEAQRSACAHIASALAPGGVVLFSPMDVAEEPPGLVRVGSPELQAFRRPLRDERGRRSERPPPPRVPTLRPPRLPDPSGEAVSLHLLALEHLERGEPGVAARVLADLYRSAPSYIPGLVEWALLQTRNGERRAAISLMREVLRRADGLDAEQLVDGPEPMPLGFYTGSARAFLERNGARA